MTIPALEDGDVKLWESHAIIAYLAMKAGSELWPTDPLQQIHVLKWLNWDTAHFSRHASRLWFENFLKPRIGRDDPNPVEVDDATIYFKQFAGVLEIRAVRRTSHANPLRRLSSQAAEFILGLGFYSRMLRS